jgi:UDP:flavonoid glycosyltransferase YjiC (YdhE family)
MAKILVVPLPEAGHIIPTLRLVEHLRSQGHAVTYLTAPTLRVWIPDSEVRIEPLVTVEEAEEECSGVHIWNLFSGSSESKLRLIKLEAVLRRIQNQESFDFVLLDRCLAKAYQNDIFDPSRVVLFSTSLPDWNAHETPPPNIPTIVFCPECFEVPRFLHPYPRLHYVEPSLRTLEAAPFELPLRTNCPLVLVTFGTQRVKDRRLEDKCKVIVQLAERVPDMEFVLAAPSALGKKLGIASIPRNLLITEKVPQRLALRHAAAFITHGGLGSIKESIMAAVPLIVLPVLNDQPFNAMRVRYHGVGEALFPGKTNVETLERLVREAVGGRFDESLHRMRSRFMAMERGAISRLLISAHLANIENGAKPDFGDAHPAATPRPNG